mmetsp:Transcript_109296/g.314790  ORF Transcript_109296/g.314790 Transcript_109296/m.314790 type:complete len:301 (+) Transcript_109296:70-972(+)
MRKRNPTKWAFQPRTQALRRWHLDNLEHSDHLPTAELADPLQGRLRRRSHLCSVVQDGVETWPVWIRWPRPPSGGRGSTCGSHRVLRTNMTRPRSAVDLWVKLLRLEIIQQLPEHEARGLPSPADGAGCSIPARFAIHARQQSAEDGAEGVPAGVVHVVQRLLPGALRTSNARALEALPLRRASLSINLPELALPRVGQGLVCMQQLVPSVLGSGNLVDIGMLLQRLLAEGPLDLRLARVGVHAEHVPRILPEGRPPHEPVAARGMRRGGATAARQDRSARRLSGGSCRQAHAARHGRRT